jgi:ferredoxin
VADDIQEDPAVAAARPGPERRVDRSQAGLRREPQAGEDLRGHIDLGICDAVLPERFDERERGFRVVLGTAEEAADFREEQEEPGGIADAATSFLENREVLESMVRAPGQPLEGLSRKGPLEVEVAVGQDWEFVPCHGFSTLDLRP